MTKSILLFIILVTAVLNPVVFAKDDLQITEKKFFELKGQLSRKYHEMNSYINILFVALLAEEHLLAFGGPGGGKTQLAQTVLPSICEKPFSLQFSHSTKEEQIKGVLNGKKYLEEGILEYNFDQCLLQRRYAILDEIDKASPDVLAASLSVLNERKAMVGDQEKKGELRSALITSNMTLNEFLEKFRDTKDEATGNALLDRLIFKVLVVNRLSSAKMLYKLYQCKGETCELPKNIDLRVIKEKIAKIEVPKEVIKLSFQLWTQLSQELEKKQQEEVNKFKEDPASFPSPYVTTNQFSTRSALKLIDVMKIGKYLENPMATKLGVEDIKYAHLLMIMQGPGEIEFGTPQTPSANPAGTMVDKIKERFLYLDRTQKMIEDLKFERTTFVQKYLEILKIYQDELIDLGINAALAPFAGKKLNELKEGPKQKMLKAMQLIENKIKGKREKEISDNGGEASEIPEIARKKVLSDFKRSKNFLGGVLDAETQKEIVADKDLKQQEEKNKQKEEQKEEQEAIKKLKIIEDVTLKYNLSGHTKCINSATFSSDGKYIGTASLDKTAIIWDTATGSKLKTLNGHTGWVESVAFSFDGKYIVTASSDKTAIIWDTATGSKLGTLSGHTGGVISATFSSDGKYIVTASSDKTAIIWDTATGSKLRALSGHTNSVNSVAFSSDGKYIVTASSDKTAIIWDTATGDELRTLSGHTDSVNSVGFSSDDKFIVTASSDKTAIIWDTATGNEFRTLSGHTQDVRSATFSSDDKFIVTASSDKTAIIWDTTTGSKLKTLSGHTQDVRSAAFSSDGKYIITAFSDRTAIIWDTATGNELRTLSGHTEGVSSATFSSDGKYIVTSSWDKTAIIWDTATGSKFRTLSGHTDSVNFVAFSSDDKFIVTASSDKTAIIWDTATGSKLRTLSGHKSYVNSATFSSDGKYIVTASLDKTAIIWDTATGSKLRTLSGHTQDVRSATFSSDGKYIVTASWDKTAIIWDTATGSKLRTLSGHTNSVNSAVFSSDGKYIVTASWENTAIIWDVATGSKLRTLSGHTESVHSAAFSSDGKYIVTASSDKTAIIWDVATGSKLRALSGHTQDVRSATFSSDDKFIVTASNDHSVKIWEIKYKGWED